MYMVSSGWCQILGFHSDSLPFPWKRVYDELLAHYTTTCICGPAMLSSYTNLPYIELHFIIVSIPFTSVSLGSGVLCIHYHAIFGSSTQQLYGTTCVGMHHSLFFWWFDTTT